MADEISAVPFGLSEWHTATGLSSNSGLFLMTTETKKQSWNNKHGLTTLQRRKKKKNQSTLEPVLNVNSTMSTWITAFFSEVAEALVSEHLNPLDKLGILLRYRFLQVPMKCSLEFCKKCDLIRKQDLLEFLTTEVNIQCLVSSSKYNCVKAQYEFLTFEQRTSK